MQNLKLLLVMLSLVLVASCSSVSVSDYEGRQPVLDPRVFFDGKICADGVVRDRAGRQIRQFNAQILATWDEQGIGTLDEIFEFDDGTETRIWTLTPTPKGAYRASASDVPEETTMRYAGNVIHMSYLLRYGEPGDTIDLNMDDWMFQVADGVVINETVMTKFGLRVGQVLLVMRQVTDDYNCLPGK